MRRVFHLIIPILLSVSIGCGSRQSDDPVATAGQELKPAQSANSVTMSVTDTTGGALPPDGGRPEADTPAVDDVTASLETISQLRVARISDDVADARESRRKRNLRIVQLATDVLRLTLGDQARQVQFDMALNQLLEARFQLALSGSNDDIEQLYADVQALNERDPESKAAADGIYYLAKFAHTKARLLGRSDPVWFENFSRWAREFADRFPEQSERATSLLFGAGRSCEMHSVVAEAEADAARLRTEAKLCYSALVEHFPATSQGAEAVAVLRRMALPGHRLAQFSGPTLDGGYINAEDLVQKITVIYFWDSQTPDFVEKLLPLLKQADEVSNNNLQFIGVPLDEDESVLRSFLSRSNAPGRQIFFPEPGQRSWNSPLIRFWGISQSPSVWLVGRDGVVQTVDVGGPQLVATMRKMFE